MNEDEIKTFIHNDFNSGEIDPDRLDFTRKRKSISEIFTVQEDAIPHKFAILKYLTLNPHSSNLQLYKEFSFIERFVLNMYKKEWIVHYNIFKLFDSERKDLFKELPETFYNSREYAEWGIKILTKFNYKCVYCGKPANHTDHLRSAKYYPELALNESNGIATCEACHKERHGNKWGGIDR